MDEGLASTGLDGGRPHAQARRDRHDVDGQRLHRGAGVVERRRAGEDESSHVRRAGRSSRAVVANQFESYCLVCASAVRVAWVLWKDAHLHSTVHARQKRTELGAGTATGSLASL